MKRTLSFVVALLAIASSYAQNSLTVANTEIPQGGEADLTILYAFDAEDYYGGYDFYLTLPDGVSIVRDDKGRAVKTLGACHESTHSFSSNYSEEDKSEIITCFSSEGDVLSGTSGQLITFKVKADATLETGTVLNAKLQNIHFGTKDAVSKDVAEYSFTITIGEPADTRVVIDEDAQAAPEDAEGVSVRVKRAISANTYSTLVLPFAMSGAQVAEVFGDDVELLDFAGYETTEDDDGNIVGITVNFNAIAVSAGIEANHPVVLKTTKDITEWTLDGVDIEVEEEPTVATVKRTKKQWSELVGSYTPITLEAQTLFLNSNKFWYSAGETTMKGLRAYFDFYDVLTDVEDALSIKIRIDDTVTGIDHMAGMQNFVRGIYDMNGRQLGEAQKGINIINGKKVLQK